MSGKPLIMMMGEIRLVNEEKGWRDQPGKTYGDFIALLHSEVDEALEAFCAHGLKDVTDNSSPLAKPEGVGSELADVLIRYLDLCDVLGQLSFGQGGSVDDLEAELKDVEQITQAAAMRRHQHPSPLISFGDHMAWLNRCVSQMWMDPEDGEFVLRALVTVARKFGIDLMAEYERKIKFNRTREFRHGGKLL